MYTDDYSYDTYSNDEFQRAYKNIKDNLTAGMTANSDRCTIILGGQPGAGKSAFYQMRDDLQTYIAINGDEFRRFHPHAASILSSDAEHYAERTQPFSNQVVETLIDDLGSKGYNLIIEGTLRNPEVPIRTCEGLQGKGYSADLVVVACDAELAWKSTLDRAEQQKSMGAIPRLVPIDIYNRTVHQIVDSLAFIEQRGCFDSITVIKRDGTILHDKDDVLYSAADALETELDLSNWDKKFPMYEKVFIRKKINILEMTLDNKNEHDIDVDENDKMQIEPDVSVDNDWNRNWDDFER